MSLICFYLGRFQCGRMDQIIAPSITQLSQMLPIWISYIGTNNLETRTDVRLLHCSISNSAATAIKQHLTVVASSARLLADYVVLHLAAHTACTKLGG